MKKLAITVILMCVWTFLAVAQTATNKIQNTATIYSTSSPLTARGIINTESNVIIGGFLLAGTNATAGSGFLHTMVVSNAGNPSLALRNYDPTGTPSILFRDNTGVDSGTIGVARNGSNIHIHAYLNAASYVYLTTQSGSAANEMYIHPTYTTNAGRFWGNSINSTNYQVNGVRGMTISVTNLASLGVSNVEVFAEGLLTNKFTIP